MNYQIVVDPALGIAAADLARAWNADPQRAAEAEASVATTASGTFMPEAMDVIMLLGTVGIGVVTKPPLRRSSMSSTISLPLLTRLTVVGL